MSLDYVEKTEVRADQLNKYFAEMLSGFGYNSSMFRSYVVNPKTISKVTVTVGFGTNVDYVFNDLNEILLLDNFEGNRIRFFDRKRVWLQDIEIDTNVDWNQISFTFETFELECASTIDTKRQWYIELFNKIDPYGDVNENDRILDELLEKRCSNGEK